MFSTVQTVDEARTRVRKPKPPAEALLLRLVREAASVRTEDAAEAAGISKARWSQVETGYEMRRGRYKPVTARPGTLARMALALGISPQRLEDDGKRRDAALVLAEILRGKSAGQSPALDEDRGGKTRAGGAPRPAHRAPAAADSGFTPEEEQTILDAAEILRRRAARRREESSGASEANGA